MFGGPPPGTDPALAELGGLQAALKTSVALEKDVRRLAGYALFGCCGTWETMSLAGARYR